jgi:chorismate-pyruvate lyase
MRADPQGTTSQSLHVGSREFAALDPFLRVVLITDGTVTRSLEAYFNEPVDVSVIAAGDHASAADLAACGLDRAGAVMRREVTLRGRRSGTAYAYAESFLVVDSLPASMREALAGGRRGIGELIRDFRLETYRDLHDIVRCAARRWALPLGIAENSEVLVRSYRIFHGGCVAVSLREVFPEACYEARAVDRVLPLASAG